MQEVDLVGTSSVANLIEQSGLTKFTISRVGMNKNTTPIFEFVGSKNTNRQARESFVNWSNTILYGGSNNNVYELYLFNDFDTNEEGKEIKHAKNSKLKMTFVLSNTPKDLGVLNGHERTNEPTSIAELVKMAVSQYASERDNKDLAKEISKLREELDEMRNEEDEEDEEPNKQTELLKSLGTILLTKLGGSNKPNEPVVINGIDEKEENVNRAIKILWKHDNKLDSDLLKLGALAENNPSQFNFLINALRNL